MSPMIQHIGHPPRQISAAITGNKIHHPSVWEYCSTMARNPKPRMPLRR